MRASSSVERACEIGDHEKSRSKAREGYRWDEVTRGTRTAAARKVFRIRSPDDRNKPSRRRATYLSAARNSSNVPLPSACSGVMPPPRRNAPNSFPGRRNGTSKRLRPRAAR